MRKKDFEWKAQLFADEPEGGEPEGNKPGGNKPEGGETSKKQEPKYTDDDLDRIINRKFAEMEKKKQKEIEELEKKTEGNR